MAWRAHAARASPTRDVRRPSTAGTADRAPDTLVLDARCRDRRARLASMSAQHRMMSRVRAITQVPRQLWTHARLERVTWLEDDGLAACRYPRSESALRDLAGRGVSLLVNLHERPHPSEILARYGLRELHLPVPDFTPPTPEQLERGVAAIERAIASGQKVAVHCGGGLGRTGTLLACYLVRGGLSPDDAIARMRGVRPGSVETPRQAAAVAAYARLVTPDLARTPARPLPGGIRSAAEHPGRLTREAVEERGAPAADGQ